MSYRDSLKRSKARNPGPTPKSSYSFRKKFGSKALNAFFSCAFIVFIGLTSVFMFFIAVFIRVITYFFDKRMILLNLFTSLWASIYTWCMPIWSVSIKGREKMDMKKAYVAVSNHQSQLDILVLFRLFFPFRWISKAEVFSLPFIGWNMVLNGYIKLKRGDKESIRKMLADCETLLAQDISVMIFPEGTRSKTGLLRPFKPGAFILAKKMQKPILPLVINNTRKALPKHSLKFHGRHEMEILVLDEIPYSEFKDAAVDDISRRVRQMIQSHVREHISPKLKDSAEEECRQA